LIVAFEALYDFAVVQVFSVFVFEKVTKIKKVCASGHHFQNVRIKRVQQINLL
jgi:hypothetical protein